MSNFWEEQEAIGSITKNKKEEVVISRCMRNNKQYLDIRIHSKSKDEESVFYPTSKGITLEVDKKDILIDLLTKI